MMTFRSILCLLILGIPVNVVADQIRVAVASNFAHPMQLIATQYERDHGHEVLLSIASSGKHFAQIMHGAPFHIFLSADQEKVKALVARGKITATDSFTYAVGRLVLVAHDYEDQLSVREKLSTGAYSRLALANYNLAPYGLAAKHTLEKLNLFKETRSKWVQGENIAQTYHFFNSGNADLAFVAYSQVKNILESDSDNHWIIPEEYHSPIKQDAALLTKGQSHKPSQELFHYLKSDEARMIIKGSGYTLPERSTATIEASK